MLVNTGALYGISDSTDCHVLLREIIQRNNTVEKCIITKGGVADVFLLSKIVAVPE